MACLVLLLAAHALGWLGLPPVARLDLALHDLRLVAFAPTETDRRIVLVDIDEQALAAIGRWPWPRDQLATLIDSIGQRGQARMIALDLVMAEPDNSSGLQALERLAQGPLNFDAALANALQQGRDLLDNDARLARSLAGTPVVLGFMLSEQANRPGVGQLPPPFLPAGALAAGGVDLPRLASHTGNLAEFQQAASQAGHLNALVDLDGRLRRLPLLALGPDGQVHASLALAMARQYLAQPGQALPAVRVVASARSDDFLPMPRLSISGARPDGVGAAPAPALTLPLGRHAEVLVPYRANGQGYARFSAADVMAGKLPAGAFQGQVVLLGVNAPGLIDQRMTPVHDALPGSAVHASLLSGLLDGQVYVVPEAAPLVELVVLLALAAAMLWALPRMGLVLATAFGLGLMLLLALGNAWAWFGAHLALPLAGPLLLPPLILALELALAYWRATHARNQLAGLFGQYVPPELVHEMSREPERYSMTPRSAELTVLFADVRGFSAIAASLSPGELSAMMNLLFSRLTDIVREHRGTLDKYIGDSVMAFWGAPLDDVRHAQHAVNAALAMRASLPAINAELARRGWPPVDIHIGVNTGSMVVGDMGSRHRRAYTVLGDAVNLAARLQQLCSQDALGLLVGDATHQALRDMPCLSLGPVPLRGRDTVEQVWLPIPETSAPQRLKLQDLWQAMRDAAHAGQRTRALALLDEVALLAPGLAPCQWQRQRLELLA